MKVFLARVGFAFLLLVLFPLVVVEPIMREIRRAWRNLCVISQVRRECKRWVSYWDLVFPKK